MKAFYTLYYCKLDIRYNILYFVVIQMVAPVTIIAINCVYIIIILFV